MRIFTFIWLGQLVSLIGIWMATFAVDIWVFQQTGSATQFALVTLTNTIPVLVISPIAGTLVDRWNRRWVIIISYVFIGLCNLSLVTLLTISQLEIWHIYLINILVSIFGTFQGPANKALITSLVNQEDLTRANGMIQIGMGVQQVVSPLLAGFLLTIVELRGILLINLATLLIAMAPLLLLRFSEVSQPAEKDTKSLSFLQEMAVGWIYLKERPGLLGLMILYSVYQFLVGFVFVLSYPLILSLTTASGLGVITFFAGIGMLTGALVMSTWGNSWQKLVGPVFSAMSLSGIWICLAGLRPSILQITIATLLFFLGAPFINGLTQVILQKKVAPMVQGRVFALTGVMTGIALPLAAITAAPLADNIFEPLMAFDGPWSQKFIGQIIGSGPGRGIGLLFVIMGCFTLMVTMIGYQYRPIRELEHNLPDYESFAEAE